jgi:hypothetical protein
MAARRDVCADRQWIEGQGVRLAPRHPATVERLSRASGHEIGLEKVEVVGIGHAERRWT